MSEESDVSKAKKTEAQKYDYQLHSEFDGQTFDWWLAPTDKRDADTEFMNGYRSPGAATRAGIAFCRRRIVGRVKLPNGKVREFNMPRRGGSE